MPDWEIIEYQDLKVTGYEDEFEIIDIEEGQKLDEKGELKKLD